MLPAVPKSAPRARDHKSLIGKANLHSTCLHYTSRFARYLEKHDLLPYLQGLLEAVVQDRDRRMKGSEHVRTHVARSVGEAR